MRGEVVHFSLFDEGAELDLTRVGSVLGLPAEPAPLVTKVPTPPYATLLAPLEVRPPASVLHGAPPGTRVELRVHAVGTVVVRIRVPVECERFEDWPAAAAAVRIGTESPRTAARALWDQVRPDLHRAHVDEYEVDVEPETYAVHCIHTGAPDPADAMTRHRDITATIIEGEATPGLLAPDTIDDALRHVVRYYTDDLVVVGWDHALVLGNADSYEATLDVIEVGNLELLELRTYDAYLDSRLEVSFEALDRLWSQGGLFRSARHTLREISDLRVEFARLTDNLHDTGKLFGEWYLARLHHRLRDRFHLDDWERAVDRKMATLEDMFQLAEGEANHRRALVLEAMIVLLFVIDLVLIYLVSK